MHVDYSHISKIKGCLRFHHQTYLCLLSQQNIQYPRCTWVVVWTHYLTVRDNKVGFSTHDTRGLQSMLASTSAILLLTFQYPRCTWVVVIMSMIGETLLNGFSTNDARGLQFSIMHTPCNLFCFSTNDARGLQCRRFWILKPASSFSTHDARGLQYKAAKKENATLGGFSTHDARGLQCNRSRPCKGDCCFSTHDARGLQFSTAMGTVTSALFQYPRCTWVVVAKSAQKQFLYTLILSQCAAFVKCFFQ